MFDKKDLCRKGKHVSVEIICKILGELEEKHVKDFQGGDGGG